MSAFPGQHVIINQAVIGSNNVWTDTYVNNDVEALGVLLKEIQDDHARELALLIQAQLEMLRQPGTPEEKKANCLKTIGTLFGRVFKVGTFIYSNHKFFLAAYQLARPLAESYGISLPEIPVMNS